MSISSKSSFEIEQKWKNGGVITTASIQSPQVKVLDVFQNHPKDFFNLHPWFTEVEIKRDGELVEYKQAEFVRIIPFLPKHPTLNPEIRVDITNTVEKTEKGVDITLTALSTFGTVVLKSVYEFEDDDDAASGGFDNGKGSVCKLTEEVKAAKAPNWIAAKLGVRQASKARRIMLARLNDKLKRASRRSSTSG